MPTDEPLSGWQPISTAPKDERFLILYDPTTEDATVFEGRREKDGWVDTLEFYDRHPTHWMPFPAPPEATP